MLEVRREILPTLAKVDAVVTDPPYGIGEAAGKNASRSNLAVAKDFGVDSWDDQPITDELMALVVGAGKHAVIFGGNYYPMPPSSCWLVWDKENGGHRLVEHGHPGRGGRVDRDGSRCGDEIRGKPYVDVVQEQDQRDASELPGEAGRADELGDELRGADVIVYLAGGMKGGWQDDVARLLLGHTLLDPRVWSTPDPVLYTARDLEAVRQCDVVLAYMDSSNPSGYGLSVEIGYAYGLGRRIVLCDAILSDWRSGYFGMHRQMADAVCHTLADAARAVSQCTK